MKLFFLELVNYTTNQRSLSWSYVPFAAEVGKVSYLFLKF